MEYISGGDVYQHLSMTEAFQEERAKFYAAEIMLALNFLHSRHIIYRDLKPENILITGDGHVKITDFGLAKELKTETECEERTKTFCGTNEYLAPEVILGKSYGESVDWWALGVVLYEMLAGWPPWTDENKKTLFKKILSEPLCTDDLNFSDNANDLLQKMLKKRVKDRIKPENIKKHPFFATINFDKLLAKEITPPFKPTLVIPIAY